MPQATKTPDVSIVIVSYNCREMLLACLASILANVRISYEVILVDSASKDGTPEAVRKEYPQIPVHAFEENIGFVKGNNFGFEQARGRYVLMLNPDTLVDDKAIDQLVSFMDRTPDCAVAGPKLIGRDGNDQASAQRFPSVRAELKKTFGRLCPFKLPSLAEYREKTQRSVPFMADWLCGACMMIRREALQQLGGLESRLFMYYEEVDWCRRAINAGWKVCCLPQLHVIHFGGQSAMASGQNVVSGNVLCHYQRSRFTYFSKHHGRARALIVEAGHLFRSFKKLVKSFAFRTSQELEKKRQLARAEMAGELRLLFGNCCR